MGAALELLLRLSKEAPLCLNLMFSITEEVPESASLDHPVAVSVSCAFRLSHCASRLSQELAASNERWSASSPGSEEDGKAQRLLESWLQVGELLINLCQTILLHCPTVSLFLAVMSPSGSPPEKVDEAA